MKHKIMLLVSPMTEAQEQVRKRQYAEIDSGGADLVKMDRDPMALPFKEITQFRASYHLYPPAPPIEKRFFLIENPDGIIFYNDQFYYANQQTKTVEKIVPEVYAQPEQMVLLNRLKKSFIKMEMNSSRRSSNEEHQLIMRVMRHPGTNQAVELKRKGIQYEYNNIRYCDARTDFNGILNAYRKCIRLYQENKHLEHKWNEGYEYWCRGVGSAQRDVMWLLQRICGEHRMFTYYNYFKGGNTSICSAGVLDKSLGLEFAIYSRFNGEIGSWVGRRHWWDWAGVGLVGVVYNLVAVLSLVNRAKSNVAEITGEQELQLQNPDSNFQHGPG